MELRPYQQQAVTAVYDYLREHKGNPCIVIPTAGGKTPVMATICDDAVNLWGGRVLVLAHVKELLEQTAGTLARVSSDLDVGLYSAGLNRRDTDHPVLVAGIQSVYRRACELGPFDLVLIDESHMLPPTGEGTYRQFLAEAKVVNPHLRVIGLTATPFRMTTGMICGPENILNEICFEVGVKELIVQGYLCPLKSKAGKRKVDTSGLHVRGGEFIAAEVEDLMDEDSLVRSACAEIVEQTADRKSVLIFAAGVNHARHIQKVLQEKTGQEVGLVTGETPSGERAEMLARFKGQSVKSDLFGNTKSRLKYLVNINVLSTGFDAPNIDAIALLRPTMSPGLYYQCCGRGFRLHPDKQDCLVLDFAGNILRHGPVDDLQIKERSNGTGEAPAKECPECQAVIHAAYAVCPECGYEFPPPERTRHDGRATEEHVLSGQVTLTDYDVRDVYYSVHTKRGATEDAPKTMRVDYEIAFNRYISEWVCFEHTGYARAKAENWWRQRSFEPVPDTVEQAVELAWENRIARATAIRVRSVSGEKFDRIVSHVLEEKPEPRVWSDPEPEYTPAIDDSDLPF